MSRRLLVPLLFLAVCSFCVAGPGQAAQVIPTEMSAFVSGSRTMIPFRALLEWMGANVDWNGARQQVTARRGGLTVVLWVGRRQAAVNGQARPLDVAPVVISGHTFIPLRFVAESLGDRVQWNPQTWQVTVYDQNRVGILPVSRTGPRLTPGGR